MLDLIKEAFGKYMTNQRVCLSFFVCWMSFIFNLNSVCGDVHTWVGVNGSALKQDGRPPVGQGPVDTVAVSCDPADICHTAKHVSVMVAEDVLVMRGKIYVTIG